MRLLIIGGSGYLGGVMARQALAAGHEVAATFRTRPGGDGGVAWHRLDIRDRSVVEARFDQVRPEAVVNTAYGKEDWATTADGAANVAAAAGSLGARFVQVSSDAVFSGRESPYTEDEVPSPESAYGAAKAAAETAVRALDPGAVIARTSLILGDGDSVHERFVRAVATGDRDGVLFTDDIRCPIHVDDLASALLELAVSDHRGIAHVAGADPVSRLELGRLIAIRDGLDPDRLSSGLRAELGPPGPLDVRLDCTRTAALLATRLRGARDFL